MLRPGGPDAEPAGRRRSRQRYRAGERPPCSGSSGRSSHRRNTTRAAGSRDPWGQAARVALGGALEARSSSGIDREAPCAECTERGVGWPSGLPPASIAQPSVLLLACGPPTERARLRTVSRERPELLVGQMAQPRISLTLAHARSERHGLIGAANVGSDRHAPRWLGEVVAERRSFFRGLRYSRCNSVSANHTRAYTAARPCPCRSATALLKFG